MPQTELTIGKLHSTRTADSVVRATTDNYIVVNNLITREMPLIENSDGNQRPVGGWDFDSNAIAIGKNANAVENSIMIGDGTSEANMLTVGLPGGAKSVNLINLSTGELEASVIPYKISELKNKAEELSSELTTKIANNEYSLSDIATAFLSLIDKIKDL